VRKNGLDWLVSIFSGPRDDHPARKGIQRRRSGIGRQVSGNSKWHRRMLAAGKKAGLLLLAMTLVLAAAPQAQAGPIARGVRAAGRGVVGAVRFVRQNRPRLFGGCR